MSNIFTSVDRSNKCYSNVAEKLKLFTGFPLLQVLNIKKSFRVMSQKNENLLPVLHCSHFFLNFIITFYVLLLLVYLCTTLYEHSKDSQQLEVPLF